MSKSKLTKAERNFLGYCKGAGIATGNVTGTLLSIAIRLKRRGLCEVVLLNLELGSAWRLTEAGRAALSRKDGTK